jgi:hypothetical protein
MLPQNINQPLATRLEVLNTTGLVATPFTGSASTTVLNFAGAATFVGPQGAVQVPSWITATNSATLGTIVTIFKKGVYIVEFYLQQLATGAAGFDITWGISQDVAVGGLTAVPSFATSGMLTVQRNVSIIDELVVPHPISVPIMVSPEQEQAGSLIRFHAALTAGGPPVDALTADAGGAWFRIRAVNDLQQ